MGDERGVLELRLLREGNAHYEIRLAGKAVDERLVRGKQRCEERASGSCSGLLDRGVQLVVDPQFLAAAAVGLLGGTGSGERQVEDRRSVGILRGPVLLVRSGRRDPVAAHLFGDVLLVGRRGAEMRRDPTQSAA